MLEPFIALEKIFYSLRDFLWNYPDRITQDSNLKQNFLRSYKLAIPFSHFFTAFLIILLLSTSLFAFSKGVIEGARSKIYTEGVVMGVDQNGNTQEINKINPLLPSNIQIEKDLVELIYEPLIEYEFVEEKNGISEPKVKLVLAEGVLNIKQGSDYQFGLKKGIKWHDGKEFTSEDVAKTFEILSTLDVQNAYVQAIKQFQWETIDKYTIRICTKSLDESEIGKRCDETVNKPILSNFLELLTVKIIPAHLTRDLSASTINTSQPGLFRSPVGTGKYKFSNISAKFISLTKNEEYHDKQAIPKIDELRFYFFKTLADATKAIQNGTVHSFATSVTSSQDDLEGYTQINVLKSPVLYQQFWGIYFNMRKTPDGSVIGPAALQDVKVRQAISMSINREKLINEALNGVGAEAFGPIPGNSYFFNNNAQWKRFKIEKAKELFDSAGWKIKDGNTFRTNDKGETLRFSLYFVNTTERYNIARSIQDDLAEVGVDLVINRKEQKGQSDVPNAESGWSLQELNEQIVAPRLFDLLLYGMNTFIDPDRYELYHSSQQTYPGLNIAGYIGSVETVKPREDRKEGESSLIRLPKIDRLLDQTRSFDPEASRTDRKKNYDEFQELLAEDSPVAYLYHPEFLYYINSDVKNIDLSKATSIETRFESISDWEIR